MCFIFKLRFGYLEQCGLGGVEFRVTVDNGLHYRGIISNDQQSGAPVKRQTGQLRYRVGVGRACCSKARWQTHYSWAAFGQCCRLCVASINRTGCYQKLSSYLSKQLSVIECEEKTTCFQYPSDVPCWKPWVVLTWGSWRWCFLQELAFPPPERHGCWRSGGTGWHWTGSS